MKLNYYPDTDSLYIELSGAASTESLEVSDGVVIDFDDSRNLVGIDIEDASKKVMLNELLLNGLPEPAKDQAS